ncbi:hypothetical protein L9F63_025017, partial [Diploptera punctata]
GERLPRAFVPNFGQKLRLLNIPLTPVTICSISVTSMSQGRFEPGIPQSGQLRMLVTPRLQAYP